MIENNIIQQGKHKNIKWELTEDGTLTISGKGDMPEWEEDEIFDVYTPWCKSEIKNDISKVVIKDGITSVSGGTFSTCNKLKEVVIPKSVTIIDEIFGYCDNLICINVDAENEHFLSNDGVLFNKSGTRLIHYLMCKPDEHYNIPYGVETVDDAAFWGCQNLKSIFVSRTVEDIEYERLYFNIFDDCKRLEKIEVDNKNQSFASVDGVLFDKSRTRLISYPICKPGEHYDIPNGVEIIMQYAFHYCQNLKSVFIPHTVKYIGGVVPNLFLRCFNLENIEIDEKNKHFKSIDGVMFSKYNRYLILMSYPCNKYGDSYYIPKRVKKIGWDAFYKNRNLYSITIDEHVRRITYLSFRECEKLEKFEVYNKHFYFNDEFLKDVDNREIIWLKCD